MRLSIFHSFGGTPVPFRFAFCILFTVLLGTFALYDVPSSCLEILRCGLVECICVVNVKMNKSRKSQVWGRGLQIAHLGADGRALCETVLRRKWDGISPIFGCMRNRIFYIVGSIFSYYSDDGARFFFSVFASWNSCETQSKLQIGP